LDETIFVVARRDGDPGDVAQPTSKSSVRSLRRVVEATILFITDKRIEGNDPVSRGFEKLLERRKIVIKNV